MRVFIALFALVAVAAAAPSSDSLLHAVFKAKFNAYKAKHGKNYESHEEHVRLNNFLKNTHTIETHNERYAKGLESFFLEHNELSDLSHQEYLNTRLGAVRPEYEEQNVTVFKSQPGWSRPSSIDWRTWKMVNKVKNQGGCGSCYTFAAVGALEAHYMRKYNRMLDLSEQQLVDCTSKYGNGGCQGGWMHSCYKYIMENGGINQQHNYPYEAKVGQCRYNSGDAQAKLSKYVMIPRDDENALADAVATVGPVAIAYDASTREFMMYGGGIYDSANCSKGRTTHAVVVVGYGSEKGVDYWILKNSWGGNWGEQGYFRMKRNINNRCGIATMSSYPIVA